jgi:hypothetical protein
MKNFFISYTYVDKSWAEWIASSLEEHGYTLTIQAWDFRPGSNFVLEMQKATVDCERTIGVLSPDWLASVFSQSEWSAAFALDPTGSTRKFVPVRVRPCEPAGLLKAIVYCDLVGLEEDAAREALLTGVSNERPRGGKVFPPAMPSPPRTPSRRIERSPARDRASDPYPGPLETVTPSTLPNIYNSAFKLLSLLRTTGTTFGAQALLRDDLVQHIQERLTLNPYEKWQYEEFFAQHYPEMDAAEKRMFSTMRSFTENILARFNKEILELIDKASNVERHIKSIPALRNHLLVWLAKFEGTFLQHPELPLLYVGVHEKVPFPSGIEIELWNLLSSNSEAKKLLEKEPNPPRKFREHASSDGYWMMPLYEKFIFRRLTEIERQRKQSAAQTGAPLSDELQSDEEFSLDLEQAKLIDTRLYPQIGWRPISVPHTLLQAIHAMLEDPKPEWPIDLKEALSSAQPLLDKIESHPFDLKKLILLLPAIAHYSEKIPAGSFLAHEWETFRTDLTQWTLEGIELKNRISV